MMKIIDELGDLSDELLKGFKNNTSKFSEYVNLSILERNLLKNNKYFWLKHDLNYEQVLRVDNLFDHAKSVILKRNASTWFTDPTKKARAIKFLTDGSNWSVGEAIELLSENYLRKKINTFTEVYQSVELKYVNSNDEIFGRRIEELDALIYNSSTNKMEFIVSIKPNPTAHKINKDVEKLLVTMKNIPNSGVDLHNYILNIIKDQKYIDAPQKLSEVVSVKIKCKNLRTGLEEIFTITDFQSKIPSSISDLKIHPEVFNSSKNEIIESTYQSMLNKF